MKKLNKHRQQLLQKKRTKRNQSRKGKVYNSQKLVTEVKTPQTDSEIITL